MGLAIIALIITIAHKAEGNDPTQSEPFVIYDTYEHSYKTEAEIKQLIKAKANQYQVSSLIMEEVIRCESNFNTTVQSRHIQKDGTQERSFGLVQINTDYNPHITRNMANDPYFSVDFLASNLSEGRGYLWTCWRQLNEVLG